MRGLERERGTGTHQADKQADNQTKEGRAPEQKGEKRSQDQKMRIRVQPGYEPRALYQ